MKQKGIYMMSSASILRQSLSDNISRQALKYYMIGFEVGWGDVDWIGLAKDRNRWKALVNSVLNLRVP
jgi:hypothetical protein